MRLPSRGDGNGFRIRWLADQVDPRYIADSPPNFNNDPVFEITIMNDTIPEPVEYFEIDLTLNPSGNRNGFFYPRAVGRVTIIDDDTRKFLQLGCMHACTFNHGVKLSDKYLLWYSIGITSTITMQMRTAKLRLEKIGQGKSQSVE